MRQLYVIKHIIKHISKVPAYNYYKFLGVVNCKKNVLRFFSERNSIYNIMYYSKLHKI